MLSMLQLRSGAAEGKRQTLAKAGQLPVRLMLVQLVACRQTERDPQFVQSMASGAAPLGSGCRSPDPSSNCIGRQNQLSDALVLTWL